MKVVVKQANIDALKFLFDKRKTYEDDYYFDYPDYGGLPKKISHKLGSDFVDQIQNYWPPKDYRTFKQYVKTIYSDDDFELVE